MINQIATGKISTACENIKIFKAAYQLKAFIQDGL